VCCACMCVCVCVRKRMCVCGISPVLLSLSSTRELFVFSFPFGAITHTQHTHNTHNTHSPFSTLSVGLSHLSRRSVLVPSPPHPSPLCPAMQRPVFGVLQAHQPRPPPQQQQRRDADRKQGRRKGCRYTPAACAVAASGVMPSAPESKMDKYERIKLLGKGCVCEWLERLARALSLFFFHTPCYP
jgi:hypothetical protein